MDKLGVIGGGAMGGALIKGAITAGLVKPEQIFLVETDLTKLKSLQESLSINRKGSLSELALECQTIMIAIKPQIMATVLKELAGNLTENHLVISIAAGINLAFLEKEAPKARFVRVMPNILSKIAKGVAAYTLGKNCLAQDRETIEAIFGCVGITFPVNESQMHAVTALSGSGPAYIYYVIESLIDAGVMLGLSRDISNLMVTQTVLGSAELLQVSGDHPAKLRNEVTSAGGTTAAGLFELEKGAVTAALIKAVQAAADRSKELSQII